MAHRPPHDLAQHVAAPFVGRDHAVRDQEGRRADVIGDHPQRHVGRAHARGVGVFRQPADLGEQRHEDVGVVVRVLALQHRGDALEAHAGVDRRRRQRRQHAVGAALELHEHVVPDFDLRIGAAAAAHEVDLRAAAARAGVAHLPEVVVGAELEDAVGRHAKAAPDVVGLVVARDAVLALEDRHDQLVGRHLPDVGQQRPREGQRLLLEVVAEREVAEHLEEGVMPVRRPDVVEVVVLAADAHHLLRGRGARVVALLAAEKQVLELVHPGVGEQQRRVVAGDERRARHDAVAVLLEVLQEGRADLVRRHPLYSISLQALSSPDPTRTPVRSGTGTAARTRDRRRWCRARAAASAATPRAARRRRSRRTRRRSPSWRSPSRCRRVRAGCGRGPCRACECRFRVRAIASATR